VGDTVRQYQLLTPADPAATSKHVVRAVPAPFQKLNAAEQDAAPVPEAQKHDAARVHEATLRIAQRLGITVSPSFLLRADEVIE
jgi:hypothetical protein